MEKTPQQLQKEIVDLRQEILRLNEEILKQTKRKSRFYFGGLVASALMLFALAIFSTYHPITHYKTVFHIAFTLIFATTAIKTLMFLFWFLKKRQSKWETNRAKELLETAKKKLKNI